MLIDDTYNANTASTLLALEALRKLPVAGRRVAVLGDMFELGAFAKDEHRTVGRHAAFADLLICVGALAAETRAGALSAGMPTEHARLIAADTESADSIGDACEQTLALLRSELQPGDAVLLKASNGMGFAAIADALAPAPVGPQA